MITIGMELRWTQFTTLLSTPRIPILGTLIHTLSFPLLTVVLLLGGNAVGIPISQATAIGMLLIAACPSGGFSNVLALIARVNLPLSVTLTTVSSVLSFVSVPLLMGSFAFVINDLGTPIELPVTATLLQLFVLVVIPVGLGMMARSWRETWVLKHLRRLQNLGQIALYVCIFFILIESWGVVTAGIGEALPWSLALCALNITLCYQFARAAGLNVEDRVTVALEGSIRNLGVALLIAANILGRMDIAVLPTVYFMAVLIVALVFAKFWRKALIPA